LFFSQFQYNVVNKNIDSLNFDSPDNILRLWQYMNKFNGSPYFQQGSLNFIFQIKRKLRGRWGTYGQSLKNLKKKHQIRVIRLMKNSTFTSTNLKSMAYYVFFSIIQVISVHIKEFNF
jgi:hypothetical protein